MKSLKLIHFFYQARFTFLKQYYTSGVVCNTEIAGGRSDIEEQNELPGNRVNWQWANLLAY